jgi:glycosyltransferase involved in cell wall biosynthesis
MKLAIIGTDGLPARYGGFETFAMEVSPRIAALGHEVLVVGSSVGRGTGETAPAGVSLRNLPLRANGVASIPFDLASFASVCRWADAVLLLGVSAGPFVPVMRRLTRGGNLLVNVDGLESRREKWSRLGRRYLAAAEALAIRGARHVIADNDAIADIIREVHGHSSTIIAYGNDHVLPIDPEARGQILRARFGLEAGRYLLTIARIEPENNIEMMIRAVPADHPVPYAILGNFAGSPYGQALMARYADHPAIRFLPATYDPLALAALRSGCHGYLHGHSVGGTNPSLVEILPYGRPVLAFDCAFNRCTLDDQGAYFGSGEQLTALLTAGGLERFAPPEALQNDPRYRWQAIAERYAALAFEG